MAMVEDRPRFRTGKCSAPEVSVPQEPVVVAPDQRSVSFNPTYEQMWGPLEGLVHPYNTHGGVKNHTLGIVEDSSISPFVFYEQYTTFQAYSYAADSSAPMGANMGKNGGCTVYNIPRQEQRKRSSDWIAKSAQVVSGELTEEQRQHAEEHKRKKQSKESRKAGIIPETPDTTEFHGDEQLDYQGRSWIAPPADARSSNGQCYFPKKCIRTWVGHKGSVFTIQFFPKYGHLLLSGSRDQTVKIWDVHNTGKCMTTYKGHSQAVRNVSFSNDGTKFLSVSFDTKIKLWDTETGKVISAFTTGKTPYVAKLHPDDDKQSVLMAAMNDKKVVQWDVNTGKVTLEYSDHLSAVNTITFIDHNRRFITSSDDNSLRMWDFGIPVSVRKISEPNMHSVPSIAVHPSGKFVAAQSMDNQVLVYDTRGLKLNRKRFHGHDTGWGCQVGFSPDGRYVISGDGSGLCWFWDWNNSRVMQRLQCCDGVCIGCEWHPFEQSKVATCGWERDTGVIKLWD